MVPYGDLENKTWGNCQFPLLEEAKYSGNSIQYLETDLFIYNILLNFIDFRENQITQISSKVGFEKLNSLFIAVGKNPCFEALDIVSCSPLLPDQCPEKVEKYLKLVKEACNEIVPGFITDINSQIIEIKSSLSETTENLTKNFHK